jgi:hypothetical protein
MPKDAGSWEPPTPLIWMQYTARGPARIRPRARRSDSRLRTRPLNRGRPSTTSPNRRVRPISPRFSPRGAIDPARLVTYTRGSRARRGSGVSSAQASPATADATVDTVFHEGIGIGRGQFLEEHIQRAPDRRGRCRVQGLTARASRFVPARGRANGPPGPERRRRCGRPFAITSRRTRISPSFAAYPSRSRARRSRHPRWPSDRQRQ